jgi:hypothetical protein
VTEHLTTADGVQDLVIPACPSSTNGGACWSLQDSPLGCPQKQALIVDNQSTGSDPARYGVVVDASCQLAPSL